MQQRVIKIVLSGKSKEPALELPDNNKVEDYWPEESNSSNTVISILTA